MNNNLQNNQGFSLLLSMVLIASISISIVVTLLLTGLDSSRTSFASQQLGQASSLVDACSEQALQNIRDNDAYAAYGSLSFVEGSCGYLVTNSGGENRKIVASSTVATMVRKVEIDIDTINPQINITSWQEVATLTGE